MPHLHSMELNNFTGSVHPKIYNHGHTVLENVQKQEIITVKLTEEV